MFQKSLFILAAGILVTLGLILAYAGLNYRKPSATLQEAEALLAQGQYQRAISLLNLTETSADVARNPALCDRLWRLRYAAQAELGNSLGALRDVSNLLQAGASDDEELLLDQIRLLAASGQGERARLAARTFVEQQPTNGRALELAGEACQTVYQPMLGEVRETIEREADRLDRERARDALLAYVYRPSGDPEVERNRAVLEQVFTNDPRRTAQWPGLSADLRALRTRVQEGLSYFQRSLDAGGEPVAAFRAVATALEQSGRIDDLLVACEIQRRQFDHAYVDESGLTAAWSRLRDGLYSAAIATAERWLPRERMLQQLADGTFGATSEDLLLVRAAAAWAMRDPKQLNELAVLVHAGRQAGARLILPLHIHMATRRMLRGNREPELIETRLAAVCRMLLHRPPIVGRPDLAATFVPETVEFLRSQGLGEAKILAQLHAWRDSRPDAVEPRVHIARYLLDIGRASATLSALDKATQLDPHHAELFDIRLAAARQLNEGRSDSGPGLVAQCIKRQRPVPDVADAIGYVLCAETAMTMPTALPIAAACARAAADAFPRASLPRRLEIEALLALQRFEDAADAADNAIRHATPDADTLRVALAAKRAAGEPIRALIHRALPVVADSTVLSPELVRLALLDAPSTAAIFVTEAMTAADAPPESRMLAVRAFATTGDSQRSDRLLQTLAPAESPELRAELAMAFAAWLRAVAEDSSDDDDADRRLAASCDQHYERLALASGSQRELFAAAAEIAERHPRTAYTLIGLALLHSPIEERAGQHFALAGDLAARLGLFAQCEDHWTAALGFADGHHVAEDLTRLLLALERPERAERAYRLVVSPTDAALAARFDHFDIAVGLVAAELMQDPADLLTHATLATFGQPSLVDWRPATDVLQRARLELLACLRNPHIGALCTPHALRLVKAQPRLFTNHLLLARTLIDSGQAPAAADLHGLALAGGYAGPVLWREAAYGGQHPGYVPGQMLLSKVAEAATSGRTAGSKLTQRYGTEQFLGAFEKAGLQDQARQLRVTQWLLAPQVLPCRSDDVELIVAGHEPVIACQILDQVLQGPYAEQRGAILDRWYRLAEAAIADQPQHLPELVTLALAHLPREGALGPIVHFLITHVPDFDAEQPLLEHLTAVATGQDDATFLVRTVAALRDRIGIEATAAKVDELLRRYPTAMPLWGERAKLQIRLTNDLAALDELRTVVGHAPDPSATVAFVGLSTLERSISPRDIEQLEAVPDALLQGPEGTFVRGLVALRQGRASRAVELLAQAPPQFDGSHLFMRAMACLQLPDDDGTARARALFEELLRDYPSSSFARNAGSFVLQLAPRADNASDNDENR